MDLRYLQYFVAVAEELSFTRAARRLHTSQPSLSNQIRRLEDEVVQAPLFRRDKRHVELTEAGRIFLPEARSILANMQRAVSLAQFAAKSAAGHLVLGFIPGTEGTILAKALSALRALHPDTEVLLRDLNSPSQIAALRNNEIDAGFLRGPSEGEDLCWELVLLDSVVVALPAQHPLAKLDRIPVPLLVGLPLVRVARESSQVVHELGNRIAARCHVSFQPGPETDGILSTLGAVGAGFGFSFLPGYAGRIKPPNVETRPLELEDPPQIELFVAYRKGDQNPRLGSFLELLRKHVCTPESAPPL